MERVPGRPDPPVVVTVNHYSVELSWISRNQLQPPVTGADKRYCYTLQQEDCSKLPNSEYVTVYKGYSSIHSIVGLKALNQYNYRLQASNDTGNSAWSNTVSVTTSKQPNSCEGLHKAVQKGDAQLVASILESNPEFVDIPNIMGFSPLMSASGTGEIDVVEVLLSNGANVNYQNSSGRTSIMEACYHGQLGCVELLMSAGSSLLGRDHSGFSSLHYAVDGGNLDTINYVLNEGVPVDDMDCTTVSGWTPLMRIASLGGDAKVARMLVERGADVNRKDNEGNSVLMMACLNGFEELVSVLLEYGADPLVKTEHGKTAVDFAISFCRTGVSDLLEDKLEGTQQE